MIAAAVLAGCTPKPADVSGKTKAESPGGPQVKRHPLAKYLELAGFRIHENKPGELRVKFAVVNHSAADFGQLDLRVTLRTTVAKPEDPPIGEFDVKIASLGPEEIREVTATLATKLRVYELPDWQYLKPEFEITSPAP